MTDRSEERTSDRCSKLHDVLENPHVLAQRGCGNDVHFSPEEIFQVPLDRDRVQETSAWVQVEQKVDVAVRARLAAGGPSEDTQTPVAGQFRDNGWCDPTSLNAA